MAEKNAVMRGLIGDIIYDLMIKSNVYNIDVDDGISLAAKLYEIVVALNDKVKTADIVNDLVTGGVDVPLSAQMGVKLKQRLDNISAEEIRLTDGDDTILAEKLQEIVTALNGKATLERVDELLEDYVLESEVPGVINDALAAAKDSGEFDGPRGAAVYFYEGTPPDDDMPVPWSDLKMPNGYIPMVGDLVLSADGGLYRVRFVYSGDEEFGDAVDLANVGINFLEPDGQSPLIVTVTDNRSSHSSSEIYTHVKAGGTAVLVNFGDCYVCIGANANYDYATFVMHDMDDHFMAAWISGNSVSFYTLDYATEEWVEKKLEGHTVDLTGYATEEFVEEKLEEHAGEGPTIVIFPRTYFETERGDGFVWDNGENALLFNLDHPITEGTTYLVTVNGSVHRVTAEAEDLGVDPCVCLRAPGAFDIWYAESGFSFRDGYKVAYQPEEFIEDEDGMGAFTPVTISIREKVVYATEEWVEKKLEGHTVDLTGYATEDWVGENYQTKGDYLTSVPNGYATEEFVKNKIAEAELGGEEVDLSGYAQKSEIPTKVSQLTNDSGYITGYTETDPTVPAWAKASTKPSYTKSEVGLGNVPNVSTNDQTPTYSQASTLANLVSGEKLSVSMGKIMKAIADLISHIGNKSNPHGVTKSNVGLGNVDNVKQYSASNPPPYPVASVNGKTGAVSLSASDVGALPNTTVIPSDYASLAGTNNYASSSKNVFYSNNGYSTPTDFKFVVGDNNSALVFGSDGLQCYSGTTSSTGKSVYLNYYGGDVIVGKANGSQTINLQGTVKENGTALSSKYAPEGYGLGKTPPPVLANANAVTAAQFFRTTSNTSNLSSATHGVGISIPYSSSEGAQLMVRTTNGAIRVRRTENGTTWYEEYLNPVMTAGTEYATVERYGGETVYVKRVTQTYTSPIGSENSSTELTIAHGISGLKEVIRWTGSDGTYTYPYFSSSGGVMTVKAVGSAGIVVRCNKTYREASSSKPLTLSFVLYYTKTS